MIGAPGSSSRYKAKQANQGEAEWIVTFGDLMSLLFCFFVLLTTLSTAPKNCNGLAQYLEQNRAVYKNFELRNSKLECVITLQSDYLFQTGQDTVQRGALERLRPLVQNIIQLPEHQRDLIIVEGHTGNLPIRTARFPSNWELSSARATNVAGFMRTVANTMPGQPTTHPCWSSTKKTATTRSRSTRRTRTRSGCCVSR